MRRDDVNGERGRKDILKGFCLVRSRESMMSEAGFAGSGSFAYARGTR